MREKILPLDSSAMLRAQKRLDNLTKPLGSLGRLEELAKQICAITTKEKPQLKNKVIFTLAADHGVTAEKVSPYPKEVTAQMVYNFLNGGAGINVLAKHVGAKVVVADIGVAAKIKPSTKLVSKKINFGTKNIAKGPAMTRQEAIRSIKAGAEIFAAEAKRGIDICGTGDMGIGNTTASSALTACLTGEAAGAVTGRGAGLDGHGLIKKIAVIKKALEINHPDANDPIGALSKVGGFEIGGLAGIILAAASRKIPVVIDGFISGAAALVACGIEPKARGYLIASHCSVEKGHAVILKHLGLKPLLNLNLRLGEGTGAALGIFLCEAAVKILNEMATFESAEVSRKKDA
jgi:nicotinate-nucleotide--dimethylbenzimidazole phosphoribosyltransferase